MLASQRGRGHLCCNLDLINGDSKGNWYRIARKKIDQQIVHGSECPSMTGPKGDKNCEVLNMNYTRMLFVTDSI